MTTASKQHQILEAIRNKFTAEDLDDQVIEMKESEASNINNAGMDAQLSYLLESAGIDWLEEYFLGPDAAVPGSDWTKG